MRSGSTCWGRLQGYTGVKAVAKQPARYLALAWMMVAMSGGLAQAQSDYLTFTGVWSTLPLSGLTTPTAVTGDSAGNLYVADSSASSIFKLAADGVTQSTVGSGLSTPQGISIDTSGNLYVTSSGNNNVYKITPGGAQTAFGAGWSSPVSVAVDGNGNVFVTDDNGLSEYTAGGIQSLLIPSGSIRGVAVDAGNNIWYGDNTNDSISRIPAGGSSGTYQFFVAHVQNIFLDASGNLYTAETSGGIRRSDDAYGDTTIFGNTTASYGVWGDTHQNLYIADHAGGVEKLATGAVDFGSVNVCPTGAKVTPCTATEVLHFALDSDVFGSVASSRALTESTVNLDYQITADTCATLPEGSSCSETMSFTPHEPGLSTGALEAIGYSVVDDVAAPAARAPWVSHAHVARPRDEPAGTALASVFLHGIGIAPVGVFNTAPIATFPFSPLTNPYLSGVAVDIHGNVYITDIDNCVVEDDYSSKVTTVAGTVCGPDSGDGGPATSATLANPWRTAFDGAGNLYISEPLAATVRRVDGYTGIITTFAGTGTAGYTGDGAAATSATLNRPTGVAVDTGGNLFIADTVNNVVRKVDVATGIITTIAGNGTAGYTGDTGAATSAELNEPDALALDAAGNLYIADDNNNVIRKVAGGVITTIAGNGTAGHTGDGGPATSAEINDPEGLTVDAAGNVYVADSGNFLIREVNVGTGTITTVAGAYTGAGRYSGDGGEAILAGLSYDEDVAFFPAGIMLIADSGNGVIRYVGGPAGLDNFGSVALGATSAAQDVTFSNVGTSSLAVTSLQVPANFTLGGADTTCTSSTTLAVNADCVLGIELAPTADGSLTGNVVIADNVSNSPTATQNVAVTGMGTGSAAAELAFAAPLPPVTAGGNLGTVAIDVESSTGALTGASSLITLTITGPGGYSHTVMAAAVNGVASFHLSSLPLSAAGTYTLTATSPNLTPAQATTTVSANLAAAAELAITPAVPTTIPAGANLGQVTVSIENSAGALIASATNPVTLTLTGPGGYSYSVTVAGVNGVAKFNLGSQALTAPGIYTLTATSAGLQQAQATVTVTPANVSSPVQLALPSALPATIAAGVSLGKVTVNIENAAGTLVSSATNSITLTISGPGGYSYTVTVAGVDGVGDFDLSAVAFTMPGTYTLNFTSGYLTAAVAKVAVTVDFTIAVTSGTPGTLGPILPGTSAAYSFTLAPASGSFSSAIALTATGLPAGATYSFSPATVTPGSSSAATTLAIQTARSAAALHEDHGISWATGWGVTALGLLLLPISGARRMRRVFQRGPLLSVALLLLALGTVAGLGGCGTGGLFGQPQQTYTVTVTGTSGSLSHSATVTLTVQ